MWIYTYHFFSFNFSPESLSAEDQSEAVMILCVTLMYGLYMFIHHPDSFIAPSPTATIVWSVESPGPWEARKHRKLLLLQSSCKGRSWRAHEHQFAWDTWSLWSDKKWHNMTTCFKKNTTCLSSSRSSTRATSALFAHNFDVIVKGVSCTQPTSHPLLLWPRRLVDKIQKTKGFAGLPNQMNPCSMICIICDIISYIMRDLWRCNDYIIYILYYITLYIILYYYIILYHIILYYTILYIILYILYIILYYILYYIILYHIILYYIILYYIILYYTIYYIILYYIILYIYVVIVIVARSSKHPAFHSFHHAVHFYCYAVVLR